MLFFCSEPFSWNWLSCSLSLSLGSDSPGLSQACVLAGRGASCFVKVGDKFHLDLQGRGESLGHQACSELRRGSNGEQLLEVLSFNTPMSERDICSQNPRGWRLGWGPCSCPLCYMGCCLSPGLLREQMPCKHLALCQVGDCYWEDQQKGTHRTVWFFPLAFQAPPLLLPWSSFLSPTSLSKRAGLGVSLLWPPQWSNTGALKYPMSSSHLAILSKLVTDEAWATVFL